MTQIIAPKVTMHVATGPAGDETSVSNLTMYVLLVPGDPDAEPGVVARQAHVYAQKIRRS